MSYVDFAALKEAVPIEQAIGLLGIVVAQKGNQWRGPCPACQSGGDRALDWTGTLIAYCGRAIRWTC